MSYESPQSGQISGDRAIQLLSEATTKKDFLYRTLFGSKTLPHVVHQIEHIELLFDIVNPTRRRTLMKFYNVYRNTLISTTSIDGKTMQILTETRIKHTTEGNNAKKSGMGLLGGTGGV